MMPFLRGQNPLTPQEEQTLGQWWETTYARTGKSSSHNWKGKDDAIVNALLRDHQDHCAYCDGWPVKDNKCFQIDHFEPKTKAPLKAFNYSNLFPSCGECNLKKGNKFSSLILKTDLPNYTFEDYFMYDSFTGEIIVNISKPISNQEKAEETLKVLKLNLGNKPKNRMNDLKQYQKPNIPLNERPYRYAY